MLLFIPSPENPQKLQYVLNPTHNQDAQVQKSSCNRIVVPKASALLVLSIDCFVMGIDKGFDLYPPLESDKNAENWSTFLNHVERAYRGDPNVRRTESGDVEFHVGEHPTLYAELNRFRRFSSKISGRCGKAEPYLKKVCQIAKKYFPGRVHWWSDLLDFDGAPLPKYSWKEVHEAAQYVATTGPSRQGQSDDPAEALLFCDVCSRVLQAFEVIHSGMDGLTFASASFPSNAGYTIVQEKAGSILQQVNSLADWVAKDKKNPSAMKAYWATRSQNNCTALNKTLFNVLKHYSKDKPILLATLFGDSGTTKETVTIELSSITLRKVGVTPHHVGTIVEPPFVSRVPPSEDGETYHTFVVGLVRNTRVPIALDCSPAQFGVFGPNQEPFLAMPLVPFLRLIAKNHRLLSREEQEEDFADYLKAWSRQKSTRVQHMPWALLILRRLYWLRDFVGRVPNKDRVEEMVIISCRVGGDCFLDGGFETGPCSFVGYRCRIDSCPIWRSIVDCNH